VVVNKPQGLVTHPAPGHPDGTLVNALLHHCGGGLSGINGVLRPGIVHRLDKDTSGLLVAAKTNAAHMALAAQIQARTATRTYRAVVHGRLRTPAGTVAAPLFRDGRDRKKICVSGNPLARPAVTHYQLMEEFDKFSYLQLTLETGRTHQIRVHMAHLGHPVAGDPVYGPKAGAAPLAGQCLHACALSFDHPRTGRRLTFAAELPAAFAAFLRALGKEG
jgi:23S rRNA pseudouridine1911/1915/1917 synthase